MYSLRHLAAHKIPRDTHACQPVRFVCKNIYGEVKNETHKLRDEYKEQKSIVDEIYEEYNDVLNLRSGPALEEFLDDFEKCCTDIYIQYDDLEISSPAMDHDEWYAYMEFIASRIAYSCRDMPNAPNQIYLVVRGVKSILDSMKAPENEPSNVMAPVIRAIRRFIKLVDKFIREYESKYSFEICEKTQRKYGKTLKDWQTKIRPNINRKIEFYESVNAVVRPICSFIPNVCKKI